MSARTLAFFLALVVQAALLVAVPWEREGDESTGQTIWLKAKAGNDRHDVMRGEYVNLTYDISDPAHFAEVTTGGKLRSAETVYAIVGESQPGLWNGLSIVDELPFNLPDGQVAIRGKVVGRGLQINAYLRKETDGSWAADSIVTGDVPEDFDREQTDRALAGAWVRRQVIAYRDLDSYFVPQSERQRFVEDLLDHPNEVLAQVRVREDGGVTLLQVRVQDRMYDF